MRGLDTNVLLRALIQDDPAQAAVAQREVAESAHRGERLHLSTIVLCEAIWTLRGKPYRLDRTALSDFLEKLLADTLFEVQDRDLVRQALDDFRHGEADFSDYLVGWVNRRAGCRETLTFDGDLRGHEGFSLLT
ncbi:MAG: type II toxin-antitoxin system VapC family toxin [Thermoanaerobaculia bacterium]